MKITLDKKILTGFIFCCSILLIVGFVSFRNGEQLVTTNQWVSHTHEVLYELEQIMLASTEAETGTRGFIITGEEDYLIPFTESRLQLPTHILQMIRLTQDNPLQNQNIARLEKLSQEHISMLEKCIASKRTGLDGAENPVAKGETRQILNEIRMIVRAARNIEQNLLEQRQQASDHDARRFNYLLMILLGTIVTVLIIVYGIIMRNLRALRRAETEMAEKNWVLTGTGTLTEAMQGNLTVTPLANAIIQHLATFLKASMGAVYIADDAQANLHQQAVYAVGRVAPATVAFGEGIVGQVAASRKEIILSDAPAEHFTLNTAFGTAAPKTIMGVPVLFEQRVAGVIVLGTLDNFTTAQREYLRLSTNSVGIAVESSMARTRTNELLEETQRQSEELEAQQEELRQSNEALHAKTELLERSEIELRAQQQELQQINVEVEEKVNQLGEQKEKLEQAKGEIERKVLEVEVSSRYKSEFLANMSHELRTPLNSILILSQLLAENKHKRLAEKDVEFAHNIHTSGASLLNLINEILDLSKIEAGKMELDIEPVPVTAITETITTLFTEIARNKDVTFRTTIAPVLQKATIATDRQRVEQILRNLLSNAFKFTPKNGTVALSLQAENNNVVFQVADTGIGIPKDKQEIIFQAFQQVDGSTKRQYGGTGLGLSISRELAHVLGGSIRLESIEGKGSTFIVSLPLTFNETLSVPTGKEISVKARERTVLETSSTPELSDTAPNDDRAQLTDSDRVVLIIEDDDKFSQVLLGFIRERGYKGIIATQGNTGVSFARTYQPIAILLDIGLPVMNGYEVLRQIKNDPALRHIPVQIISAYDKKREGMLLGAFDYMHKPVSVDDLHKAFERIENFTSKKLKKLLIVEDNVQQNNAIRELIGNGDVKSYSAYRGTDAYDMLEHEAFDCIIVDLGLPDMTGFDLMEKIRANDRLNKIPIVVYTGRDLKKEDTQRLGKLADTVVLKTANSQERLLDETILFLHRVEAKLPPDKQDIIRRLHRTDEVLKDKTILLVDDDIRNIYSLTNALEDESVHCLTAENGRIALEVLQANPSIDLVLMDIMMPEMDGYETTIAIRKDPAFQKLPIIALTAKAMKGDKEKCLTVGMSDYISKPVDVPQLLSLMRVWLYK
ncbi:response regulator [Fulvivirgaceae bacterium PWU5]|uniref:histidine kinase n=1 Tax=Dawidia cretensis TaxID=2782350 RepID=A0AAP2GUM5_9BACT|nr:response regulator [Dawidia cretensis]MBT1709185.1 response regulator [Dawidia cretensis]